MPVHILGPAAPTTIALPFFSFCVPAGFPSPALFPYGPFHSVLKILQ